MTASPVVFDLNSAQDALARSDEGVKALPGDVELITALEGFHSQEWDRFQDACDQADRAVWLAAQCVVCGPDGSTGDVCDECVIDDETTFKRVSDR